MIAIARSATTGFLLIRLGRVTLFPATINPVERIRMSENKAASEDRLLSWAQVRARVPLSRGTVWALRRKGAFPKAVQISQNRIAWRASDLDAWISERAGATG